MDDYQVSTFAVEVDGKVNAAKSGNTALLSQIALNLLYSAKLVNMFMISTTATTTVDTVYWNSFSVEPKRGTLFLTLDAQIKPKRLAGACKMLTVGLGAMAGFPSKFLVTIGMSTMAQSNAAYAENY